MFDKPTALQKKAFHCNSRDPYVPSLQSGMVVKTNTKKLRTPENPYRAEMTGDLCMARAVVEGKL